MEAVVGVGCGMETSITDMVLELEANVHLPESRSVLAQVALRLHALEAQRDHARGWASYYRSAHYGCTPLPVGAVFLGSPKPEDLEEWASDDWSP